MEARLFFIWIIFFPSKNHLLASSHTPNSAKASNSLHDLWSSLSPTLCLFNGLCALCLVAQSCPTLCDPLNYRPPGSFVHGDSPGKNTGAGCHALLQGIFPTQGSNSGLPYCRQILYHLSHKGSPRILEWVAYPLSRGSFQPRNQIGISCIAAEIPGKPLEWNTQALHKVQIAWSSYSSTSFLWSLNRWLLIPWTEEPGRLQSMGSLRVRHDWATSLWLFTFMHWRKKWQPTPVFLLGESQGWGSLVGCRLWGHTESDTTEVT